MKNVSIKTWYFLGWKVDAGRKPTYGEKTKVTPPPPPPLHALGKIAIIKLYCFVNEVELTSLIKGPLLTRGTNPIIEHVSEKGNTSIHPSIHPSNKRRYARMFKCIFSYLYLLMSFSLNFEA